MAHNCELSMIRVKDWMQLAAISSVASMNVVEIRRL
jgi:hypothetical protein